MYKPWISYRVKKLFYFYFFLISNFGNHAEIRIITVWAKGGEGWEAGFGCAGNVRHACMYISEPFFKCKSCTFLGEFWFFLGFFFVPPPWAFCSEASFIYSQQFETKNKNYVQFVLNLTVYRWYNTLKKHKKRLW